MDAALGDLAEAQFGVVSRRQAMALGIGAKAIEARVRRSSLRVVHRGVYAVGHRSLRPQGYWMAAVLAGGPGTALSHRAAAACWGIAGHPSGAIDVTRPRSHRPRAGIRFHQAQLRSDEVATVEGIPVTGLSRTLLDNAAVRSQEGVMRLIHEAEIRRLTDSISVHDLLRRYPRRQGVVRLRAALASLASGAGVTRRELERRFAGFLADHGLPSPRRNADIAAGDRFFCGDCVWGSARLIVELDSWTVHGTRRSFEADKERDRILVAAGWRIIHVTWRQLHTEPASVAADIRAALGALPSHHGI